MQLGKDRQAADIKIVLLGDSGVGKTNIFTRICQNEFSLESKPTKDVHIFTNNIMIEDNVMKVQVWDTAGDNKFASVKKTYLKNAHIAIIVCDITRKQSFRSMEKWLAYLKTYADPQILTLIVGNKMDLKHMREVQQNGDFMTIENKTLPYLEVSALNFSNIELMYHKLIAEAYLKLKH